MFLLWLFLWAVLGLLLFFKMLTLALPLVRGKIFLKKQEQCFHSDVSYEFLTVLHIENK